MTDTEIVAQANELARLFYARKGYRTPKGYRFDKATHPHKVECWDLAKIAFDLLR